MENATDVELELLLGRLLRTGVSISAALVLAGGVWYISRHGGETPQYSQFRPLEINRPDLRMIGREILAGQARSLIQAGLLVLIATPLARVLFSLVAFARQGDWLYVGFTAVVSSVLLYSLFAS